MLVREGNRIRNQENVKIIFLIILIIKDITPSGSALKRRASPSPEFFPELRFGKNSEEGLFIKSINDRPASKLAPVVLLLMKMELLEMGSCLK